MSILYIESIVCSEAQLRDIFLKLGEGDVVALGENQISHFLSPKFVWEISKKCRVGFSTVVEGDCMFYYFHRPNFIKSIIEENGKKVSYKILFSSPRLILDFIEFCLKDSFKVEVCTDIREKIKGKHTLTFGANETLFDSFCGQVKKYNETIFNLYVCV